MEVDYEDWKFIPGYGDYMISSGGLVKSYKYSKERTLEGTITPGGYRTIGLSKKGVTTLFLMHRLVLSVFVGEAPEGYDGSHLDGDKLNNNVSNLNWESRKENLHRRPAHAHSRHAQTVEPEIRRALNNEASKEDIAKITGLTMDQLSYLELHMEY